MDMIPLQASARKKEVAAKALRRTGQIPCIVYGFGVENTLVQCPEGILKKAYNKAGESTLVELELEGNKKIPVLFTALDRDPVSDRIIHADFYAVNMKKEVEASVPLRFLGEAPAVKELGAVLVTPLTSVTVKCLPANLPHDLPLALDSLTEFHATLTIADLKLPEGVAVLEKPDIVLAMAQEPREEEVVAPVIPVAEAGAATAEGAAAAPAEGEEGKEEGKKKEKKEE